MPRFLFFVAVGLTLHACQQSTEQQSSSQSPAVMPHSSDIPDDFLEFYRRFHQDDAYQLEHIIFPLKGLPQSADSATIAADNYFWQKEGWVFHKSYDYETGDFSRKFIRYTDELITEQIRHRQAGMGLIRRYARLGDDWFLIYYAALNNISTGQ
jgi:hypothetical protein